MKKILDGLKILLVEEEVLVAMDIEQQCYDHGALRVFTISNQAKLEFNNPELEEAVRETDAAILDVKIGEGWTTEIARRLVELRVPFVFATGYTTAELFFAEFPQIPVVAKPYEMHTLLEALELTIRGPRLSHSG